MLLCVCTHPVSSYVIDDEPLDRRIFEMMIKLVNENSDVDTIFNGKNAIETLLFLSKTDPGHLTHYIFSDINMPVMIEWGFLTEYHDFKIDHLKTTHFYVSSSVHPEGFIRLRANSLINFFSKITYNRKTQKYFQTV